MFLLFNPLLLVAETRIACVRKRPQSVTGRGLAMKMHRSGGGACCVSATSPLLVAENSLLASVHKASATAAGGGL